VLLLITVGATVSGTTFVAQQICSLRFPVGNSVSDGERSLCDATVTDSDGPAVVAASRVVTKAEQTGGTEGVSCWWFPDSLWGTCIATIYSTYQAYQTRATPVHTRKAECYST
jgi:hypothetical protein